MSDTRIDNLVIDISSTSTGASKGIDELAKSLQALKKASSFNKVSENLNKLQTALNGLTITSKAVIGLNSLARSLEKLKNVKSIASLSNNLKKFPEALSGLKNINIDAVAPKIASLVSALEPLGKIKSGGFGTMIRSLSGLDKVTENLDDDKIEAFAEKVKRLTEKLTPLSDKMTTVAQGFKAVNTQSRKTRKSLIDTGSAAATSVFNFSNLINVLQGVAGALNRIAYGLKTVIAQAIEWDGVAARFGRGFGSQAQETYEWIQRLNKEMGINVQQFMQYSSIYATMLTGFGVATEDATKMALGYTELTYDIWAGYNDIYKTYADAADAVRSAIAGEVEPIRRAGFTVIESTLEQTAANHGLQISLETATEAQKSYLRYLTLVDQAHAQSLVGTYAKEMNTAEGVMRTLSQQVKSLAQAFGSLFIPVLVKVIPYVQAFVELLTDAVHWVANLFGIEIQSIDWGGFDSGIGGAVDNTNDFADSAGNAADAVKELKNAAMGFDELNVIDPNSGSAGAGGAGGIGGAGDGFGGLDIDSLWDESIFDSVNNKVDELKQKMKNFAKDMLPIVSGIGTALAGWSIRKLIDQFDLANKKLGKFLGAVSKGLMIAGITITVGSLVWDFTGTYLETSNFKDLAKILGTTVIGAGVAAWLTGQIGAGIVLMTSGIISLTRLAVELKDGTVEFTEPQSLITAVTGALGTVLGGTLVIDFFRGGVWIKGIAAAIKSGFETAAIKGLIALDSVKAFVAPIGAAVKGALTSIGGAISGALKGLGAVLAGMSGWVVAAIAAIASVLILGFIKYDFTNVGETLGKVLAKFIGKPIIWIGQIGQAIWDGINSTFKWLTETFTMENIVEFLGKVFSVKFWLATVLPWMTEIGRNIVQGLWSGITGWYNNLIGNIKEFINGFVGGWKKELGIASPSKVFTEIGGFLIEGLWLGIKNMFNTIYENISKWVADLIAGVKSFFGIKTDGNSTEMSSIGNSISGGLWSGINGKYKELRENFSKWSSDIISEIKGFFGIGKDGKSTKFDGIGKSLVQGLIDGIGSMGSALWRYLSSWGGSVVSYVKGLFNEKAVTTTNTNARGYSLELAANGGVFDKGSLIWAGEYGAEIVANANGGQTGVMNVEQMQEAVARGVAQAMAVAMQSDSERPIVVELDGEVVYRNQQRVQKKLGYNLGI